MSTLAATLCFLLGTATAGGTSMAEMPSMRPPADAESEAEEEDEGLEHRTQEHDRVAPVEDDVALDEAPGKEERDHVPNAFVNVRAPATMPIVV